MNLKQYRNIAQSLWTVPTSGTIFPINMPCDVWYVQSYLGLSRGCIGCKEKWQMSARKSLLLADRSLFSPFQHIFRTPLQDYSLLIHLHQRHLPRLEQGVDVTMATRDSAHKAHIHKMSHTKCSRLPVVDFDPAQQYLRELEVRMSLYLPPLLDSFPDHMAWEWD